MSDEMNVYEEEVESIAVIGMSGRFPGADNIEKYYDNIRNGVESIIQFSDDELRGYGVPEEWLKSPNFVKSGTVLDGVDKFDASFFGYTPAEATCIDPQQRLFLESAWESLEDAGYTPESCDHDIGVFAGASPNDYINFLAGNVDLADSAGQMELMIGNEKDFLATRASYKLNLKGPSMTVQTGCSTSLVAVQMACQSLLSYQCSLALAGTSSIKLIKSKGYFYQDGSILSPDGHCRAFDAQAHGTVVGQGVAVVTLKRLSEALADGDHIYAIIKGCAVNNDGGMKVGYTAPSVEGQANVIAMAQALGDTPAESIGYVEAHGTGTSLGDPIEIEALSQAFRDTTSKKQFCAVGSVKTNIGHADISAGLAGMIKAVLMLKHKEIPPSLNYEKPNPNIDFEESPFFVPTELTEWVENHNPRRAGVSSFGIGGTNAHVVLEEAPQQDISNKSRPNQLLVLSGRTEQALKNACKNLSAFISKKPNVNLANIAYTLQVGRRVFNHRRVVVCTGLSEAIAKLEGTNNVQAFTGQGSQSNPPIAFMFSGQGSQYAEMGRGLYHQEPTFRKYADRCLSILSSKHQLDLSGLLFEDENTPDDIQKELTNTAIAQPALFVIEYALARLWMSWGIKPEVMIGHSIGEYVAATLCGVFTLEDALKVIVHRGQLLQSLPKGAMLSVSISEKAVARYLENDLSIAAVNAPNMCVISGPTDAIEHARNRLNSDQIENTLLHTSHAFHSKMVAPAIEPFIDVIKQVPLQKPTIRFISNVTGTWITDEEAMSPEYWGRHIGEAVRFSDGVQTILKDANIVLLEVGPGNALTTLSTQHLEKPGQHVILPSMRHPKDKTDDQTYILGILGKLWISGVEIDWVAYHNKEKRHRISLPTYPFQGERFWPNGTKEKQNQAVRIGVQNAIGVEDEDEQSSSGGDSYSMDSLPHGASESDDGLQNDAERKLANIWQNILGLKHISRDDNYFELGGSSLMAVRLFRNIEKEFQVQLPLATLYQAPTVAMLSEIVNQEGYQPSWTSLVEIQPGKQNRTPVFFMHSEGGNVLEYHTLARQVGKDQPFYGLQAIGLDGKEIVSPSIAEMAASFIKEIKKKQPTGPYIIGGYCLGGLTAYEMAQQLNDMGDEVKLMFLISTSTPTHLLKKRKNLSSSKKIYYKFLDRVDLEIDNLSSLSIREMPRYIKDRMSKIYRSIRFVFQDLSNTLLKKIGFSNGMTARTYVLEKSAKLSNDAYFAYTPKPYEGRMSLIHVSNRSRSLPEDPYLGWSGLSKEEIQLFKVDAYHKNVLLEPQVQSVSRILKANLSEIK